MENKDTIHPCIPVSFVFLELFKTPENAVA